MVTNEHCFIRICLGKQRSFTAKPRDAFHSQSRTGAIGGGHWGGNQNRNTAKKIGKNRNTASKVDGIPKPHLEMSSYFLP